jgi:hypothetical protein
MVPHLATIDDELHKSYLLAYFPSNAAYRKTYEALKSPDDATVAGVLAEKQAALDAADTALREVRGIPELERGFTAARNAALLWKDIAAIYFRLLQGADVRTAVEKEIGDACAIERESGQVWPVYPAARGITAYDFAREAIERGKLCCISVPACR